MVSLYSTIKMMHGPINISMQVCLQILYRIVYTAIVQRVVSAWLLSKLASSYDASDLFSGSVEFNSQLGNQLS